jgi:Cu(I)/Ag(I) efflux system membrane fusion protein
VKTSTTLIVLALLAAAGAGGYFAGQRARAPAAEAPAASKPLYYRNPMGLADTSPTPKKDPMGMDYVPVYAGDEPAAAEAPGQIRIGTEKVQKLGVRTEPVTLRVLGRTVRASGRIEADERRIAVVSPKFEGYVVRLFVNATGHPVEQGQPLFEVYSAELVSAQREYVIAMQGVQAMKGGSGEALAGMQQLAESSLVRLRNWDLSPEDLDALVKSGEPRRTLTLRSPVAGIVTEKKAFQGMRFMPGEALFQVTDLSSVWVVADVPEQDIGLVRPDAKATVRLAAYPSQGYQGTVSHVFPTLNATTRSVPVHIELATPGLRLMPAMFAQVEFQVGGGARVLAVPDSAVIDSGTRRIVLVDRGEGRFEAREVKLGARSDTHVEVLEGVREGEAVVVAANFLIDAESNLKAAIGGLAGAAPTAAPTVGHRGEGSVDGIDAKAGTVSLSHGPIASLKWPAMTMEFKVANPSLLAGLKPGAKVAFEFVERQPGEWVITSVKPQAAGPSGR